jgi:hypothetical protein
MLSSLYKIERAVPLHPSQLEPNDWNPNRMKERTQEALRESLDWVGQVEEILVRPHPEKQEVYQIINGEHRWKEMQDEEVIYVNIIHDLSDAEAKKLTVVLDSTRGEMDKIDLAKLLADIQQDMGVDTIKAVPYTENELNELIKLSEADWDNYGSSGSFQDAYSDHQANQQRRNEATAAAGGGGEQYASGGSQGSGIQSTFQGQQGQHGERFEESGDHVSVFFKASHEDMELIKQAYELVQQEGELDENPAIAWGQVIARIAKEFIGYPRGN